MPGVQLTNMVEKMNLKNLTPEIDLTDKKITIPDINRLALQLTGFFEHFDSVRTQIIGYVEYTYLQTLTAERKKEIYQQLFTYSVPCLIYTTDTIPDV